MSELPQRTLLGHPAGLFLVSATEMWERFSYYGITALLVFFMTAPLSEGGFAWTSAEAIKLYGLYAGLAFASPAIGGWISSTWLGERRCITLGGVAIMVGHVLLGAPVWLPELIGLATSTPAAQIPHVDDIRQGGFLTGLGFIILGTALIKPTISSIVGKLYAPGDPRRSFGFTLFMVGVWSGSFLANFIAGTLGERFGWHWGFMAAAVGMAVGLSAYLLLSDRLLGDIGRKPDHTGSMMGWLQQFTQLTVRERRNVAAIAILSLFTIVYAIAFYQKGGLIHLLVRDRIERHVGGFEIPASWFLSVSTGSFLISAPLLGYFLTRSRRVPDTPLSVVIGLSSLALAYAILFTGFGGADGPRSMGWIVAAYVLFGLADVFIWPPQLAAVTALAPKSMKSFMVGAWWVTVGLGTYGAGFVGAWAQTAGVRQAFGALLLMLLVTITVALILRPWMLARSDMGDGGDS